MLLIFTFFLFPPPRSYLPLQKHVLKKCQSILLLAEQLSFTPTQPSLVLNGRHTETLKMNQGRCSREQRASREVGASGQAQGGGNIFGDFGGLGCRKGQGWPSFSSTLSGSVVTEGQPLEVLPLPCSPLTVNWAPCGPGRKWTWCASRRKYPELSRPLQAGRRTHSEMLWKKGIQNNTAMAWYPGCQTLHTGDEASDLVHILQHPQWWVSYSSLYGKGVPRYVSLPLCCGFLC